MNKMDIVKNKIYYALIATGNELKEGLDFFTNDSCCIQVASWNYKKEKLLGPHIHNKFVREANITQEFIYIKKGSLEATIYDNNDVLISKHILKTGDFAIMFAGGHGYKILENDTEVIEVKNGPYAGPEKDRRKIDIKK